MNAKYVNDAEYSYVNDTDRKAGHVIAPAGYGKTTDEKVALDKAFKSNADVKMGNMASHRLLLTEQNATEIMECNANQEHIFSSDNTIIISNSSANEDNYKSDFESAIQNQKFHVLTMDEAFDSNSKKVLFDYKKFSNILVASCYPSLPKYFRFRDALMKECKNNNASIIVSDVYDETHKMVLDEKNQYIGTDEDDDSNRYYVDMDEASKSTYLTGYTATPNDNVTERFAKINDDYRKSNGLPLLSDELNDSTILVNNRKYIKYVSVQKSINMGRTLPAKFHISTMNEGVYKEPDRLALYILAMSKTVENPNNEFHTMVTLSSMEQVKNTAKALYNNHDVKVFSTTSEGRYITEPDGSLKWYKPTEMNLLKFKERVESVNDSYIILQCEQLNEGLNITGINTIHEFVKSPNYTAPNTNDEAKHTQRTGRANRVLKGEFGLSAEQKTKKFGNVIVSHIYEGSEDENYESFKGSVRSYSYRVYGNNDVIEIYTPSKMPSSGTPSEDLKYLLENFGALRSTGSTPNGNGRADPEKGGKTVYNYRWSSLKPLLYSAETIVQGWLHLESLMEIESFRKDYKDKLELAICKAFSSGNNVVSISDLNVTSDEVIMSKSLIISDILKMLDNEEQTGEVLMMKKLLA